MFEKKSYSKLDKLFELLLDWKNYHLLTKSMMAIENNFALNLAIQSHNIINLFVWPASSEFFYNT